MISHKRAGDLIDAYPKAHSSSVQFSGLFIRKRRHRSHRHNLPQPRKMAASFWHGHSRRWDGPTVGDYPGTDERRKQGLLRHQHKVSMILRKTG
jgi:hypothetical protein